MTFPSGATYFSTASKTAVRKVTCSNTGKVKTATFILKDAHFPKNGYTGTDLQIRALKGDPVIRFVRVLKLEPIGRIGLIPPTSRRRPAE